MITLLLKSGKIKVSILLWYKNSEVKKIALVVTSHENVRNPFSASDNALQAPEKEEADNVFRPVKNYN